MVTIDPRKNAVRANGMHVLSHELRTLYLKSCQSEPEHDLQLVRARTNLTCRKRQTTAVVFCVHLASEGQKHAKTFENPIETRIRHGSRSQTSTTRHI